MDHPPKSPERKRQKTKRFFAWSVHFYTALGLVAAGAMVVAIIEGGAANFRLAFLLMVVATVIDATDGTLARRARVKEVLPGFDGRRLDDLIDFQTYTALPLLLLFKAGILPPGQEAWLLVPLLASAYGFCQVSAKTDDGYFLGFPSYWNVIAFYLYVLKPPGAVAIALLLFFSVLTFVPFRYLYPTQRGRLNRLTNQLGVLWCLLLVWILGRLPDAPPEGRNADDLTCVLTLVSLFFPAYYLGMSWLVSVRLWKMARRRRQEMSAKAVETSAIPHG
ncbi:MAG TPA: CDP-alcohol phosphatidyltransferase family protein [Gemmataceae bacterium]|nr:CDP-alcohol phosphatidyltransferase family protein [Gemmataceae bacterium]